MGSSEQVSKHRAPRILTVGIGSFGKRVGRLIKRKVKNAHCIFPDLWGNHTLGTPETKNRIRRSDVVFLALDVRDEQALDTAKQLVEEVIAKDALKMILTFEQFEGDSDEEYVILFEEYSLPCTSLVVSPLSLNPLPEDFLPKFGVEMIASALIRNFVEMFVNWADSGNDPVTDFAHLKVAFGQGGILRMGDGMSFKKDASEALQLAKESLVRQISNPRCF